MTLPKVFKSIEINSPVWSIRWSWCAWHIDMETQALDDPDDSSDLAIDVSIYLP